MFYYIRGCFEEMDFFEDYFKRLFYFMNFFLFLFMLFIEMFDKIEFVSK